MTELKRDVKPSRSRTSTILAVCVATPLWLNCGSGLDPKPDPDPDRALPLSCSASGGRNYRGVIQDATWRAADGPHRIYNEWTPPYGPNRRVEVAGTLVIQPGALVCFAEHGAMIIVRETGTLIADGTSESPIDFRYMLESFDFFAQLWVEGVAQLANASFGPGTALSTPWHDTTRTIGRIDARRLALGPRAGIRANDIRIEDVVVEAGCLPPCSGLGQVAVILRTGFSADGLRVRRALSLGVSILAAGQVSNCEVVESGGDGVQVRSAGVRITNCNIVGNAGVGVHNFHAEPVDARGNWWGDPAGPFGPNGTGVSGNVLYEPWLSEPVQFAP
jgi:hypothetical protein